MTNGIIEKLIATALGYLIFQPEIFQNGIGRINMSLFLKLLAFFVLLTVLERKFWWNFVIGKLTKEARRQSKQISGKWKTKEDFNSADFPKDICMYDMELICNGGIVKGTQTCVDGYDKGKTYVVTGTYKDQILNLAWTRKDMSSLESGTASAKLNTDGHLEGHGIYLEPDDGKIHTSTFAAERITELNKE
jgi:hypothetical protein